MKKGGCVLAIAIVSLGIACLGFTAQPLAGAQSSEAAASAPQHPQTPQELCPKLKVEDRATILELQKKAMADQVRIDQITQQAQAQIQRLQQEMQGLVRQIGDTEDKALANIGVDKAKCVLNADTLELTPAGAAPKAEPPKKQ